MRTRFSVGDVVTYNGKQCVVYIVKLFWYDLCQANIHYQISDGKHKFWIDEGELKN